MMDRSVMACAAFRVVDFHHPPCDEPIYPPCGQLMDLQDKAAGKAKGADRGGKRPIDGLRRNPETAPPTLANAGISTSAAHRAEELAGVVWWTREARHRRLLAWDFHQRGVDGGRRHTKLADHRLILRGAIIVFDRGVVNERRHQ